MLRKQFKKTTADKWFSIYIRLRDSMHNGMCQCITCGKYDDWRNMTCGHFDKRGKPATRFKEKNCAAQSVKCNAYCDGEQFKHGRAIDQKYGLGTAEYLMSLGSIRGQKIHTKTHLDMIAKEFRLRCHDIARQKGIEL